MGKRRSRIWKDKEGILLARNLQDVIFLLYQYAWPIDWRRFFTSWLRLGPVNSRFLIFTEQFTGFKKGKLGESVVRGCIEQWTIFSVFFFFPPTGSLVNEHLDFLREIEKGFWGARHETADRLWRGLQENLRHRLPLVNLVICGTGEDSSRSFSKSTLNYSACEEKRNVWPDDLS